jgi:uncharacterized protein YdeI (YjbR/CyaY-like superfamily)
VRTAKTLLVTSRAAWRAWLSDHHDQESEIWLVYYKRHTKRPRIPYADAVEEALCFGWIDSIVRRLDEGRFAQKFTPRRLNSRWSDINRRRFAKLVAAGRVTAAGLGKSPPAAATPGPPARKAGAALPRYIAQALKQRPRAWKNFSALAPSYRRLYVGWIDAAVKEETRRRRLAEATALLLQNKKLGLK